MKARSQLIGENTLLLEQLEALVATMPTDVYRRNNHEYFGSGVGKHVRHILDFYERFLDGCDGSIDYDARKRDARVEQDPGEASRRAAAYSGALALLEEETREHRVRVRTCTHGFSDGSVTVASSLERELAHLSSHTIHHFALIATILRIQGISPPEDFGVAPSTLRHERSGGAKNTSRGAKNASGG